MPKPKIYAPIHAVPQHIKIPCPFARIMETEDKIRVVYCEALARLVTRYEAELCSQSWRSCPYAEIASRVRTGV